MKRLQRLRGFFIGILLLAAAPGLAAETPSEAAVASAKPLATEAGIQILKEGGNAFDAAVAVAAALAVVEPYSSGLGGGGFWLLHQADTGRDVMVDGREKAPRLASENMYLDANGNVIPHASTVGPLAAGIPGVVKAMVYIEKKYGRLPLSKTLAPAIHYARDGFKVTPMYRDAVSAKLATMKKYPQTAAVFAPSGFIPRLGDLIVQKDLARLLENIAKHGSDAFYRGAFAQKLVNGVGVAGGIWTREDLADYNVVERKPREFAYHNMKIVAASLPSSGGVVLQEIFGILSHFDLNSMDDVHRKHTIIEAMRRAYRDRAVFLGDPDHVNVPVARITAPEYLAGLAASIEPDRATPSAELSDTPGITGKGHNTTHFSIIDTEGNRAGVTLSINLWFGSCFMVKGTGVLLNDEMDDFAIKPHTPNSFGLTGGQANAVAPNKRPLSSMTPVFVSDGHRVGVLGSPGGSRIITMDLLGILDFEKGHGPASWVRVKRYHQQYLPDVVQYEPGGLTPREISGLKAMGYNMKQVSYNYGNMNAVMWDKRDNKVYAASDPRDEGMAEVVKVPKH